MSGTGLPGDLHPLHAQWCAVRVKGACTCGITAWTADSWAASRTLRPGEVAPTLLANIRSRGDEYGDLANAPADDLREALLLAIRQLDEREAELAQLRGGDPDD